MKTTLFSLIAAALLSSCATETIVTTKRPDGKETTTVTTKKPSEGIVTAGFNALLGGFLNVFQAQ